MIVRGGVSFGAVGSDSDIGLTILGSATENSTLHQDACNISEAIGRSQTTNRFSAERNLLNLQPAWTHDLSLDHQQLEGCRVGAEDMAECGPASGRGHLGFCLSASTYR